MAARAGLWLAVGTAVLAACAPGPVSSPGSSPTADAGTADRLVRFADRRGYRVERRDPLPGLGLELITLRLPPGTDPVAAIAALEGREPATTVGRNHAYRDAPVPAQPAGPRTYAGALLGWPAPGCPARQPVGIIDTALDPAAW